MFRSWFTKLALALIVSVRAFSAEALQPAYYLQGIDNTHTSFRIIVKVHSKEIAQLKNVRAQVEYAPLHSSTSPQTTPMRMYAFGYDKGVPYLSLPVTGLQETTMYRARLNVYNLNGVHLGSSSYYYTTTTGDNPKSIIRNRMVLKGLREFYDSELGLVGKGGTVAVDGTRYGADVGEAWCSEFYSWVGTGYLKNIKGISNFNGLMEFFRKAGGLSNRSAIPTVARRGDYLAMDTDEVQGTNHSGMFLAYEKVGKDEFVWTLEGNSGKKIRVNRRPLNKVFTGLGHIMASQF